jgi:hypothetical protein
VTERWQLWCPAVEPSAAGSIMATAIGNLSVSELKEIVEEPIEAYWELRADAQTDRAVAMNDETQQKLQKRWILVLPDSYWPTREAAEAAIPRGPGQPKGIEARRA